MGNVFYPGSFDLPTLGHMGVVDMALKDRRNRRHRLIVIVGVNEKKLDSYLFDQDVRIGLMKLALHGLKKSHLVDVIEGNSVNEAALFRDYKPIRMVRGIRDEKDRKSEQFLADRWLTLYGTQTEYYESPAHLREVSSTAARAEFLGQKLNDASLERMVPKIVLDLLKDVLAKTPEARTDRKLLNDLVRNRLTHLENQMVVQSSWQNLWRQMLRVAPVIYGKTPTPPTQTHPADHRAEARSQL